MKISYEDLKIIIEAAGVILGIVITYVIKPLISAKVTDIEQKRLNDFIERAVRCANQIFTPEEKEEKKNYVYTYVTDLLEREFDLELTYNEIDILIEGFVNSVKNADKKG